MQREFQRRKSQYTGYGPETVVVPSSRRHNLEGNSGGTGDIIQGRSTEESQQLLSPMDIHEPIEGVLVSEAEKNSAPKLMVHILEGASSMVG